MLNEIGFEAVQRVAETGFNSSPKTRGMLVRARKPFTLGITRPSP